jgi:hypothetical protein
MQTLVTRRRGAKKKPPPKRGQGGGVVKGPPGRLPQIAARPLLGTAVGRQRVMLPDSSIASGGHPEK